ncbi:hypothetical protein AB0L82_38830 [Nocardia sp. NPDC052001]|uniref:hypothetical protein n=1 Tax=Nocardia sp. NPDC052001 TaxID=3154853 RepID=UPI003431B143
MQVWLIAVILVAVVWSFAVWARRDYTLDRRPSRGRLDDFDPDIHHDSGHDGHSGDGGPGDD